jgi:hypothetical protein
MPLPGYQATVDALPEQFAGPALFVFVGAVALWLMVLGGEQRRFKRVTAGPRGSVLRAPCERCGASLVAAELLYVVDGELLCHSCSRRRGGPGFRRLDDSELRILQDARPGYEMERPRAPGD